MGKCYPIIRFWIFGGISHLYSQPNRLMERAIKKVSHGSHQSPQSHFAVPTMEGMTLGRPPRRRSEIHRPLHRSAQGCTISSRNKATVSATVARRRTGRERLLGEGKALGKVPNRSPVCLRSKPECGFVSWGSCSRLHLQS